MPRTIAQEFADYQKRNDPEPTITDSIAKLLGKLIGLFVSVWIFQLCWNNIGWPEYVPTLGYWQTFLGFMMVGIIGHRFRG